MPCWLVGPLLLLSCLVTASPIIDGYTSHPSVFAGDAVGIFVNSSVTDDHYQLHLYDLKGRIVHSVEVKIFPQTRLDPKPYQNGFNYHQTAEILLPSNLQSGIYLFDNVIPIVVKGKSADVVVLYPSNTANAYANSGGKSLYGYNSENGKAANTVSFLRPIAVQHHARGFLDWAAKEPVGQQFSYITDAEMEDYRAIKSARLMIIIGHSEYWTVSARRNFDRFIADGGHAMILSGNTMWWQVRYTTTKNALICYKDEKQDPVKNSRQKTVLWNSAQLQYPLITSIGVDFSLGGYGRKIDHGWDGYNILINSPLLEGTLLKTGDILHCPSDELDGAPLQSIYNGKPVLDKQALGAQQAEIVGFDRVMRGGTEGYATWIVFRRSKTTGIIINTASTDWCAPSGIGRNRDIQRITMNMINKLLGNETVFSPEQREGFAPMIN